MEWWESRPRFVDAFNVSTFYIKNSGFYVPADFIGKVQSPQGASGHFLQQASRNHALMLG